MTMHGAEYGGTFGPLLLAAAPGIALVARRRRLALALGGAATVYFAV